MCLLGVGYIGGSVALSAKKAGLVTRVVGYDPDAAALDLARERGVIDEARSTPEDAARGAKLVVLAAPVGSIERLARTIAHVLPEGALVVDVGSVKTAIVREVDAILPGRFVGCHPIAGAEHVGVEAAVPELFLGCVCYQCPGPRAGSAAAAARAFWEALGAHVVELDPGAHDTVMAALSHMPHVAAFALAAALASVPVPDAARQVTGSLRDTTRIAASSPLVWRDILLGNQAPLLPLVRAFEARVGAMRRAMEAGDGAALERELTMGRDTRERLVPRQQGVKV
jgi:prephenate dehydrogenase